MEIENLTIYNMCYLPQYTSEFNKYYYNIAKAWTLSQEQIDLLKTSYVITLPKP